MPDMTEYRVTSEIDIDADNPHAPPPAPWRSSATPRARDRLFGVTARSGGVTTHVDFHDDAPSTTN